MNEVCLRPVYPNELYHHGIKGQKWGVRRYQNPDGSLTAEGKKRYEKSYARKIDDSIEKRQKASDSVDRAMSSITDMTVRNILRTYGGIFLSGVAGSVLSTGAGAAAIALNSVGLLTVASVAPSVATGAAIGIMAKGIYNHVQLNKARKYYEQDT